MKKSLLMTTAAVAMIALTSFADAKMKSGGFAGPKGDTDMQATVEQAKNLNDEAYVTMKGNIVKKIGNEKYLFKDNTGTIEIEIDDDDWNGLVVAPEDVVIIEGEVDKGWYDIEIEVDQVKVVNPAPQTSNK